MHPPAVYDPYVSPYGGWRYRHNPDEQLRELERRAVGPYATEEDRAALWRERQRTGRWADPVECLHGALLPYVGGFSACVMCGEMVGSNPYFAPPAVQYEVWVDREGVPTYGQNPELLAVGAAAPFSVLPGTFRNPPRRTRTWSAYSPETGMRVTVQARTAAEARRKALVLMAEIAWDQGDDAPTYVRIGPRPWSRRKRGGGRRRNPYFAPPAVQYEVWTQRTGQPIYGNPPPPLSLGGDRPWERTGQTEEEWREAMLGIWREREARPGETVSIFPGAEAASWPRAVDIDCPLPACPAGPGVPCATPRGDVRKPHARRETKARGMRSDREMAAELGREYMGEPTRLSAEAATELPPPPPPSPGRRPPPAVGGQREMFNPYVVMDPTGRHYGPYDQDPGGGSWLYPPRPNPQLEAKGAAAPFFVLPGTFKNPPRRRRRRKGW